jgi:mannose-6-phosphate isomerase-like protein (cupin superfamily)
MPTIISPQNMVETRSDQGWSVRTVADARHIGAAALVARWWTFDPSVIGPAQTRGAADELLYVIRGTGQAVVDDQRFDLNDESVLWVEAGETYYFIAGETGLEILQGYAPGEAINGG